MSLITFEINPYLSHSAALAQTYVASAALKEPPSEALESGVPLTEMTKRGISLGQKKIPSLISFEEPQLTFVDRIATNPVFNRLSNDLLGVVLPTIGTEFLLRGWKRGVEMSTVMASYVATTFVIPTALMPLWNKMAANEHNLPGNFIKLHEISFEELLDEQNISTFENKLKDLEGEKKLNEFLDGADDKESRLKSLREKLIKAKSSAIRKNVFTTGLFANLVYWFKNWFAKNVLGVTGFTGELNVLDENQVAKNSGSYEKNKFLLFSGAILSYLFGSHIFSNSISRAASLKGKKEEANPILNYMRKNIDTFDVKDGKFPKRGNLFGMYMTGGVFSYFFASRSVTEFIENVIRLAIWFPMAMWGDTYIKTRSASKMDANFGTSLLEYDKKTKTKTLKSLEKLYKELQDAKISGNQEPTHRLAKSIEARRKIDLTSLLKNALMMGVGLTAFNALFSNWRLKNGIGVS